MKEFVEAKTPLGKAISFAVLVAAVLLATAPRLVLNYGMDQDAARAAVAAERLAVTGKYTPSRLPGNPLFEYLLALIVPRAGHLGSNLLVFSFYLLCVWSFSLLAKGRRPSVLLKVLFALTPIILLNAATTMDYLPGLALMLCACVCAVKSRFFWAFVLLGFSVGFRLSNLLFAIPLGIYSLLKLKSSRALFYPLIGLLTAIVFYIPIFEKVGFSMFNIPDSNLGPLTYLAFAIYRAIGLFGPLATGAILVLLVLNRNKISASITTRLKNRSPLFVLEITTVILFSALYLLHADETAYLIPIVPFTLLLLERWFSRIQLLVVAVLIVSSAVFTLEFKGGESGRRKLVLKPAWGSLIDDYLSRKEILQLRASLKEYDFPAKAVILTGMGPMLTYCNEALIQESSQIEPVLKNDGSWNREEVYRLRGRQV
ncbi:MAG: hypothetical protein DRP79_08750, partial [Planctomycetota bacterium]